VGACGAGPAGSESQPYLEGGIDLAAFRGGGARMGCSETPGRGTRPTGARGGLRIGFGENRETRCLPCLVSTGVGLTGAWSGEWLRPVG
jgi:hypothetical protein